MTKIRKTHKGLLLYLFISLNRMFCSLRLENYVEIDSRAI